MSNQVLLSVDYIPNPSIGKALSLADIYVGIVDLDPKTPANQKQISVLQENGTTVQVSQPISTSAGGVPLYNGSPVTIFVEGSYSLRIDDSTGAQVYCVPKNAELEALSSFSTIADLRAITETPTDGDTFTILGYYTTGDGGGGQFRWDSTSVLADDGGKTIKVTAITTGRFIAITDGAISVLRYGAKGDGVTDDEPTINACLAIYNDVFFPDRTYMVNVENRGGLNYGIQPRSNTILTFEGDATLQAIDTADDTYRVLLILQVDNVTVYGGKFSGDKDTHLGATGEAGHAIGVYLSSRVKMYNCEGSNGWGVGLAVFGSNNCYFENLLCDNNRQNGIGYIYGVNNVFVRPRMINTSGTSPAGGMDIEPNTDIDLIQGLHVIDPITTDNEGAGIIIALNQLREGTTNVSINIDNHVDTGSAVGISFEKFNESIAGGDVKGSIVINNPVSIGSQTSGIAINNYAASTTPSIYINHPTVIDCDADNSGFAQFDSGITAYRAAGVDTYVMGNFTIVNPDIRDTRSVPNMVYGMYMLDDNNVGFANAKIIDPIEISGTQVDEINYFFAGDEGISFRDRFNVVSGAFSSTKTLIAKRIYTQVKTSGGSLVNFILETALVDNDMIFQNETTNGLKITPEATVTILPISTVGGKYIQTTELGASITLKKLTATEFYIQNMVGTWTVEP